MIDRSIRCEGKEWSSTLTPGEAHILWRGTAYRDGCRIDQEELVKEFEREKSVSAMGKMLSETNGFFAFVVQGGDYVLAAVDSIRSIPLFYGVAENALVIGDDAEWVRSLVGDHVMDPGAVEDFSLAGYTMGRSTLFPNVRQLQAGEMLYMDLSVDRTALNLSRYYMFLHDEPSAWSKEEMERSMFVALDAAIDRTLAFADGRQIVIPLSGGYDSRLIASLLKSRGYSNILCFTYGLLGNAEARTSQEIAAALGFRWEFVEYSTEIWSKEWSGEEAAEYRRMSSGHSSLPHVQDWLAIKLLLLKGAIQPNAVVVPGHSADFLAGSHLPGFIFRRNHHSESDLANSMVQFHMSNAPIQSGLTSLTARVLGNTGLAFDGTSVSFANIFEAWDWQERQSKYIVNSVRVYDQFELQWWLPFWDLEFVKFWAGVPLALRRDQAWYTAIAARTYSVAAKDPNAVFVGNAGEGSALLRLVRGLSRRLPVSVLDKIRKVRRRKGLRAHYLGFSGLIDPEDLEEYLRQGYNLIGIYSDLYLKNRWGARRADGDKV